MSLKLCAVQSCCYTVVETRRGERSRSVGTACNAQGRQPLSDLKLVTAK